MHRLILATMILGGCTFPPLPPLDPDAESDPDAQGVDGDTVDASEMGADRLRRREVAWVRIDRDGVKSRDSRSLIIAPLSGSIGCG